MAKVSVIIICHNDQEHILDAIRSAQQQTERDIEIICVDDGSTDSSLALMQQKKEEDPRIRIISKEQGGTFSARYAGIQIAQAEFFMFLDSDDRLNEQAVQILVREIAERKADILEFGADIFYDEKQTPAPNTIKYFQSHFVPNRPFPAQDHGEALLKACFEDRIIEWFVWNKLYKTSLIRLATKHYNGEWINNAEDALITLLVLFCAEKYDRLDTNLYQYRIGGGMSTKGGKLGSDADIKNASQEWNIIACSENWLRLLSEELNKPFPPLQRFHEMIAGDCFRFLLSRCLPGRRNDLLSCTLDVISREQFFDELRDYVYDRRMASPEMALEALRGSEIIKAAPRPIHTIAMYYPRLYNGGVEKVIARLSEILHDAGYRLLIVTENAPDPRDYPLPPGTLRAFVPQRFQHISEREKEWKRILAEHEVDCVIYHGWADSHLVPDSFSIKSLRIPLIVYIHESVSEAYWRPERKWNQRGLGFALADCVIALSRVDCAWWKALGLPVCQMINPMPFDALDRITPSDLKTKEALWVGRLDDLKQYQEAFDIADLVHARCPDFVLRVIGSAETEAEMTRISDSLKKSGRDQYILLEGFQTNVAPYYQNATIYLCTSKTEGFSMTIAESKAYGIPLVSYDLPNLDFFRPPRGMICVPQQDRSAAASGILALLNDEDLRSRLGREARESIEPFFRVSLGEKWKQLLEKLSQAPWNAEDSRDELTQSIHIVMKSLEERSSLEEANTELRIASITREMQKMNTELYQKDHELYLAYNSSSWKIGRKLTAVPRKIKQLLKKLARR